MYWHCDGGRPDPQSRSVISQLPLKNLSTHSGLRFISSSKYKPLHSLTIWCFHHLTVFIRNTFLFTSLHWINRKTTTQIYSWHELSGLSQMVFVEVIPSRGGLHRYVGLVLVLFCPFSAESFTLCILRCCGARQLKASLFLRVSGSLVLRERALSCTVSALDSAWRCSQMEKPCLEDVLWDIKALLVHCF